MRALALVSLAIALAACGLGHSDQGVVGDGGGSGSGGSGGGSGSGSGGPSGGPCPSDPPTAGSRCAIASDVACEYGSDPNPACDVVARCASGQWAFAAQQPTDCPTPAATSACPASYDAVPIGGDCSPAGLACGYPEGRCVCAISAGGPVRIDAGTTWSCDRPTRGCPVPRPRLGSSCAGYAGPSQCDYGGCTLPQGVGETCRGGVWSEYATPCPL